MAYANYQDRRWPFAVTYAVDLLRFRHLCWNLVGSDLRSRFRRSRIGILWGIIQPLAFALMLAAVWGTLFKDKSFWQFTVYLFSGLIVWDFFIGSMMGGLGALINSAGYLRQSRVPFIVFQARVPLSSAVMFALALTGLVTLLGALNLTGALAAPAPIGLHYLLVPAFVVLMVFFTLPLAILFSLLGAQFRDTQHIVGLVTQGLFFISPVMLPRELLATPSLAWLKYANPAVSMLDLFRQPLLQGRFWDTETLVIFGCWTVGLWVLAIALSIVFGRRIVFAL